MADQPTQLSEANWSAWVTALRKHSSARRMSAAHIDASDSLSADTLWPTPNVPNGGRTLSPEAIAAKGQTPHGKRQVGLENVAKLWPTPNASVAQDGEGIETWERRRRIAQAKHQNGNGFGTPLTIADQLWPTPVARDFKGANSPQGYVNLPTFITHHWRRPGQRTRVDGPPSSRLGPISRQRLNPAFVEWLMGWPPRWSSARIGSDCSAMAYTHWRQRSRSAYARTISAFLSIQGRGGLVFEPRQTGSN